MTHVFHIIYQKNETCRNNKLSSMMNVPRQAKPVWVQSIVYNRYKHIPNYCKWTYANNKEINSSIPVN